MVHLSTLKSLAVGVGVVSLGGALFFSHRIQANFRNEEYYKKSMQLLRHYRPAVETLGEPIRSVKLDLADTDNNRSDGLTAKLAIPLKGSKSNGKVFCFASRARVGEEWTINQLDLEIKDTGKRWTFYKYKGESTQDQALS